MLTTIGYEGSSLSDFIRTLAAARVEVLVDVRERAQSRRKGFSKSALAAALNAAGIEYVHLRELGDPKEGRDAARGGQMEKFRSIYRAVLQRPAAKAALQTIVALSQRKRACLMCYEAEYMDCHRKLVADKLAAKASLTAQHLRVKSIEPAAERSRRVRDPRQSAASSQ